ncbi:hypothetical protein BDQ17DRAFT_613473 [Cyathus striatus]|nr:hypothetical protein BDQ17DRAFT_613473 [Cyathus striatus]
MYLGFASMHCTAAYRSFVTLHIVNISMQIVFSSPSYENSPSYASMFSPLSVLLLLITLTFITSTQLSCTLVFVLHTTPRSKYTCKHFSFLTASLQRLPPLSLLSRLWTHRISPTQLRLQDTSQNVQLSLCHASAGVNVQRISSL